MALYHHGIEQGGGWQEKFWGGGSVPHYHRKIFLSLHGSKQLVEAWDKNNFENNLKGYYDSLHFNEQDFVYLNMLDVVE